MVIMHTVSWSSVKQVRTAFALDGDDLVTREEDSDEDSDEGTPRASELRGPADGINGAKISDADRLTVYFLGCGAHFAALEHVGTLEK